VDDVTTQRPCPSCGRAALRAVDASDAPKLLCLACRRCWREDNGRLFQVGPYDCPGCPDRHFCMFLVDSPVVELSNLLRLTGPGGGAPGRAVAEAADFVDTPLDG